MMVVFSVCVGATASGAEPVRVPATDSVAAGDDEGAAAEVLQTFAWSAEDFAVGVLPTPGRDWEAVITFDSPQPAGDDLLDRVTLRWYRPAAGPVAGDAPLPAAGVLLVHSLHPELPVATMLARGLRQRGVHAFVMVLPGYGGRSGDERRMTGVTTLLRASQAVTDARRSLDAIRAVGRSPAVADEAFVDVDTDRLAIQGTSLGSFIAAAAAAIDAGFYKTFLLLSGGDGISILTDGQKDAFHVRNALRHYGIGDRELPELIRPIEPMALAHRLNPRTTWMYNARDDLVVPAANARMLAEAIGLPPGHHVWMPGNHYTSFLLLPGVLEAMAGELASGK
jgi:alpha-beta hydrolase superfamily lysophospholipase